MAFRVRPFYNIHSAVGKRRARRSDDVMLVQLFLNEIAIHPGLVPFQKPSRPLVINGNDDDILEEWIVAFQSAYKKSFNSAFLVDGIVDKVPGYASQQTTITHTSYSLALLNNNYESFNKDLFPHIWDDKRCPPALKAALLENAQ